MTGPVYVEGGEPGDVLAVDLLEFEPADWGWMGVEPSFGFLTEDFPETNVFWTFALNTAEVYVEFSEGIRVPLKHFCGALRAGIGGGYSKPSQNIPHRDQVWPMMPLVAVSKWLGLRHATATRSPQPPTAGVD